MPPRLFVYHPSPTTVRFTVSDAPQRLTIPSKLAFLTQIFLRIFILTAVCFINAAKCRRHFGFFARNGVFPWEDFWSSPRGAAICRLTDDYNWVLVIAVDCVLLHLIAQRKYTEESILVIRGLGIQTSTSSSFYFCSSSTRFIPTTQIQDIIIHEAFKGFEVKFYLAVIVEGESEVGVVFPNLLPSRLILEDVWRGSRKCLYDLES